MSLLLRRGIISLSPSKKIVSYGNDLETVLLVNCDGDIAGTTLEDIAIGGTIDTVTCEGGAELKAGGVFNQAVGLDGVDSYIYVTSSNDIDFGTGDFCIDMRVKLASIAANVYIFAESVETSGFCDCNFTSSSNLRIRGTSDIVNITWSPSADTWYHLTLSRKSGTLYVYADGVYLGGGTLNDNIDLNGLNIGSGRDNQSLYTDGDFDEIRISKGTSRIDSEDDPLYISSGIPADGFTPPYKAYSEVTWAKSLSDIDSSLLASYNFEATSGAVVDSGPASNDGTISGTVTRGVTGKINDCFEYTEAGYVDTGIVLPTTVTYSLWVKRDSLGTFQGICGDRSGNANCTLYIETDGDLRYSGDNDINLGTGITDTNWHLIIVEATATTIKIWIDNTIVLDDADTRNTGSGTLFIGNDGQGGTNDFDGFIDLVNIWSVSLTETQRTDLYNNGQGLEYEA